MIGLVKVDYIYNTLSLGYGSVYNIALQGSLSDGIVYHC
mgnify:FL=1